MTENYEKYFLNDVGSTIFLVLVSAREKKREYNYAGEKFLIYELDNVRVVADDTLMRRIFLFQLFILLRFFYSTQYF